MGANFLKSVSLSLSCLISLEYPTLTNRHVLLFIIYKHIILVFGESNL